MTRRLLLFQPPTLSPGPGGEAGGEKSLDVPMIGAIVAAVFILLIIVLAFLFYRKKNYSCCKKGGVAENKDERKRAPSLSDIRLTSTGGKLIP